MLQPGIRLCTSEQFFRGMEEMVFLLNIISSHFEQILICIGCICDLAAGKEFQLSVPKTSVEYLVSVTFVGLFF